MRKLWVTFSLRLSLVLCLATAIPILVLYLLSEAGWVEAAYDVQTGSQAADPRLAFPILPLRETVPPDPIPPDEQTWAEDTDNLITRPTADDARLPLTFDEQTGMWRLDTTTSQLVVSVPAFKLRIDLPAWIAIMSMPLASLILGVGLSIWMSHSVTRPFSALAQAAQAISNKALGTQVEAQGSQELQNLADSFNRMSIDLEKAEATRRNLMADVAHELRTPLAVLDGNLRALLDGVRPLDDQEIAILKEQTQHLSRVVEDLREISLAESNQLPLILEQVELEPVIMESARHFQLLAQERRIDLKVDCQEGIEHPRLDAHRMKQILHNLLSNAFRHTPDGGRIAVNAMSVTEPPSLMIEVRDTGHGIPVEAIPHLFDRFHRPGGHDIDSSSTGLGLPIVKAMAEAQGGRVEVESRGPGQGSTFRVIFPLESDGAG